jgi:hypothetical protein
MQRRRSKRRTSYENRFRDRPISGGRDLSCYGAERLPALHPFPPPPGVAGQFMGALYVSHYLWVIFAFQVIAGALLLVNRYVPLGGAGDCQHPYFPRLDGPERASGGPLCGCTVGRDLHRRATGLFRVVPVALTAAGLTAGERNQTMAQKLTVVVTGSTGKQGGAVARGLLERGHKVRAVTRDPNSSQAKLLANAGATLVAASLSSECSTPVAAPTDEANYVES